jgi:hypothetical protein
MTLPDDYYLQMERSGHPVAPMRHGLGRFLRQRGCSYVATTYGRWHYIGYPEGPGKQLFDLETDSSEANNIAYQKEFGDQRERLCDELILRLTARSSDLVLDGKLLVQPPIEITEFDLRNINRLGCITESLPHDIRD